MSSRIRNCKMELPEEGCPKPGIRKKVGHVMSCDSHVTLCDGHVIVM